MYQLIHLFIYAIYDCFHNTIRDAFNNSHEKSIILKAIDERHSENGCLKSKIGLKEEYDEIPEGLSCFGRFKSNPPD